MPATVSAAGSRSVEWPVVHRVSVVGATGAGKSRLAGELARRLGVPHIELDAIYHQPNWTPLPAEEFRAAVRDLAAGPGWVIDGNYSTVWDLVASRADSVVVLDLSRWQVTSQLLVRTLRRAVTGQELWNGNREELGNLLSRDPDRNILLWSWTTHTKIRQRYRAAARDPRWSKLRFVRVGSRREARTLGRGG
ncbi:AAA family ATPase [soil metagenome]